MPVTNAINQKLNKGPCAEAHGKPAHLLNKNGHRFAIGQCGTSSVQHRPDCVDDGVTRANLGYNVTLLQSVNN